jgi:hypothetical protein
LLVGQLQHLVVTSVVAVQVEAMALELLQAV